MPKCVVDGALHQQVLALIQERGGNVAAVSTALGIDRTKFWRFVRSGRALTKTRLEISQRIARHTAGTAAGESAFKMQQPHTDPLQFSHKQAGQLRDFCRQVILMIDIYVEATSSREDASKDVSARA